MVGDRLNDNRSDLVVQKSDRVLIFKLDKGVDDYLITVIDIRLPKVLGIVK